MEDRPQDGRRLTIRHGRPDDARFVVALGTTAFARFGRYGPIMEGFLATPAVAAFIAEVDGASAGFVLVDCPQGERGIADLVAIAVDERHRRTGVGRALLARVVASREARGGPSLIVLTVADDNAPAIALFRSFGFEAVAGTAGRYDGGQMSHRMARARS